MNKNFSIFLFVFVTGCAGVNSDFGCNKTAGDACLWMTEANILARNGGSLDDIEALKKKPNNAGEKKTNSDLEPVTGGVDVWVAPYTDNNGVFHRAAVVEIK